MLKFAAKVGRGYYRILSYILQSYYKKQIILP